MLWLAGWLGGWGSRVEVLGWEGGTPFSGQMLSGDQPCCPALPAGFSGFAETVFGKAMLVGLGPVTWASYSPGCTT